MVAEIGGELAFVRAIGQFCGDCDVEVEYVFPVLCKRRDRRVDLQVPVPKGGRVECDAGEVVVCDVAGIDELTNQSVVGIVGTGHPVNLQHLQCTKCTLQHSSRPPNIPSTPPCRRA